MTLGTNPVGELYYNPGQTKSLKGSVLISFNCNIVNCIERYFNVSTSLIKLKQGQNFVNEIQNAENIKYRLA